VLRSECLTEHCGADVRVPEIVLGFLLATALWALFGVLNLPDAAAAWLHKWQTLVGALAAATVASIAIYFAVRNTTLAIRHAEDLETRRRTHKHAALRALLPDALANILNYSDQSSCQLVALLNSFSGGQLPAQTVPMNLAQALPSETLRTLADFIEYSDMADVGLVEAIVALIQIHEARLRDVVTANHNPQAGRLVLPTVIEERIIDAASIYAGAAALFEYARRQQDHMPQTVSWDEVTTALSLMHFWDHEYPNLYAILAARKNHTSGPLDKLMKR